MSTKVVIDSFDTEEQAICFVDWLKRQFDMGRPRLVCVDNIYVPAWDGIDNDQTDKEKVTINIVVDYTDSD